MASQPSDLATRGARNYWLHLSPSKVKCSQSVYRHRSVAEALRVHVGGDDMFIFSPYFVSSPPLASSPLGRNNTSPFSFFQVSAVTFKWRLIPGECCRVLQTDTRSIQLGLSAAAIKEEEFLLTSLSVMLARFVYYAVCFYCMLKLCQTELRTESSEIKLSLEATQERKAGRMGMLRSHFCPSRRLRGSLRAAVELRAALAAGDAEGRRGSGLLPEERFRGGA